MGGRRIGLSHHLPSYPPMKFVLSVLGHVGKDNLFLWQREMLPLGDPIKIPLNLKL